jgi:hypothetical protein
MATRPFLVTLALVAGSALVSAGCGTHHPLEPEEPMEQPALAALQTEDLVALRTHESACWGQATQVFARMGAMGEHSSQFPTPRLGLRNLARELYADGILPDDSMQALGAFVADALGLSIEACK